MKHSVVSIDLAKNVFQVCALDDKGAVAFNKKITRNKLMPFIAQLETSTVVMEAGYSSNHWGRQCQSLGHTVKLVPAYRVKPFVVGNKNDANDALAIAEASLRPRMNFVSVKTFEQQDLQTIYRVRERLMKHRTALVNQLRGLLSEYGMVVGQHACTLKKALPDILEDADNGLTLVSRKLFHRLSRQWHHLDEEIKQVTDELHELATQQDDFKLLMSIPGFGPIVSSVLMASVGDIQSFKNGRQLAAWVGLTPRQYASGDVDRLGKISKRGNLDLRKMLIHGARTLVNWCQKKDDPLSRWLQRLLTNKHSCQVVVALANKMARMAWAILTKREEFNEKLAAA